MCRHTGVLAFVDADCIARHHHVHAPVLLSGRRAVELSATGSFLPNPCEVMLFVDTPCVNQKILHRLRPLIRERLVEVSEPTESV